MALTDAQRAYNEIKERIICTQMPPGALIQIHELMAEIGLGRTPIREALKLLEAEKLVTVSPRRGMFVTDVSITDLLQVHEIRMELDALCVSLAVERITPAELDALRRLVADLDAAAEKGDGGAFLRLDRDFHAVLAAASHNHLLQAEVEKLYNLSLRIWYLCVNQLRPGNLGEGAFKEVLAAIEARDAKRASHAMRMHILQFNEAIKASL